MSFKNNSNIKVLYKRPDNQVFGIESDSDEFRSVVPSDLADIGEGYMHSNPEDAQEYLLELMHTNMTETDIAFRFKSALMSAEDAFWASVVDSFPEIKTGDLSPDVTIPFKLMMENAVVSWLKSNAPNEDDIAKLVPESFLQKNVFKPIARSHVPSNQEVKRVKETYPIKTRLRLDKLEHPNSPLIGSYGTITEIDNNGRLHVELDNGESLWLIVGADEFTVLTISIEDFVASRVFVDDVEKEIGCDNGTPNIKGYVYKGSYFIQQLVDGSYYLPISRDEHSSSNLEELEKILYNEHFSL